MTSELIRAYTSGMTNTNVKATHLLPGTMVRNYEGGTDTVSSATVEGHLVWVLWEGDKYRVSYNLDSTFERV